jgi:molybdopterin/thiamine biosynthesis adenylyltransferase
VGGVDLITLARLGIGRFTIADPDSFEVANFNRQHGATINSLGRNKAEVMAELAQAVNPSAEIRVFKEAVNAHNADDFLEGADVFIDGIEAFEIDARRLLFQKAAKKGLYALSAGPVGFSGVWVIFDPQGTSFDRYFDISDDMDAVEKFAAFIIGMAPKATHRAYTDMTQIDVARRRGPSVSLACELAAGAVSAEVLKILLKRGPLRPAPCYHQFDVYLGRLVKGRIRGGNRHPMQRLKRRLLERFLRAEQAKALGGGVKASSQ